MPKQHWDEAGALLPSGIGKRRWYILTIQNPTKRLFTVPRADAIVKLDWVASNRVIPACETAMATGKTATEGWDKKKGIKPSGGLRRASMNGGLLTKEHKQPTGGDTSPGAMRPLINILLCNDDPVDSKLLRAYLQRLTDKEIVLFEARYRDEIHDALGNRGIDLVLVGSHMARKLGMDWVLATAKEQPAPIVILTEPSTEQCLANTCQDGVVCYSPRGDLSAEKLGKAIDIALDKCARLQQAGAIKGDLERLAAFDSLTGLYSRVAVLTKLRELISLANRYKDEFSLIMLDIDRIKSINDHYGQLAGDEVLKGIATLIRDNVRDSDIVGRWAGDEFVIIPRRTDLSTAWAVAERLRSLAQKLEMKDPTGNSFFVTVSLGVVEWEPGEDACSLIRRASEALYKAKQRGPDRVQILLGPSLRDKI